MAHVETSGFVLPSTRGNELATLFAKLRLLALRRFLNESVTVPRPLDRPWRALKTFLPDHVRRERRALEAFEAFEVLVPLLTWESGALEPAAALTLAGPNLLVGLAEHAAPPSSLLWDAPFERLSSEGRWFSLIFTPPAAGLTLDPRGVELRLADGRLVSLDEQVASAPDTPFHVVTPALPRLRLCLADSNPLALLEAHPDKAGNRTDLGGRTPDAWCQALAEALELVWLALPALADEMRVTLRRIVPVGYEGEMHLSASYREAPGLVYLTLHPDLLTLAEALIHETQHGKLNALSFFDAVLENGHTEWAPSPVRPDLRPLMGVLLAAHAFVPVAEFHRRLAERGHELTRTPAFARRRAEVLASNARGLAVLAEKARPTALGARVVAELAAMHAATTAAAG